MIQNSDVIPAANMNCCSAEGSASRTIVNIVAAPGIARRNPARRACRKPRNTYTPVPRYVASVLPIPAPSVPNGGIPSAPKIRT